MDSMTSLVIRIVLRLFLVTAISIWTFAGLWVLNLCLLIFDVDLGLPWMFGLGMLSIFLISGFGICLGVYELLRKHQ